jgi:hypothetical protein
MPPAYVRPYVKRQKNDAAGAEAICKAVTRTSFVPAKTLSRASPTSTALPTTFYRSIKVDDFSIFYREAGRPDAPTLLLPSTGFLLPRGCMSRSCPGSLDNSIWFLRITQGFATAMHQTPRSSRTLSIVSPR